MRFPRSCGVLVHPTSFPSRYGIGDMGAGAYNFIDFLVTSRQSIWQILPLGPTGFGDSPYQSFSAFAGNPLLIDPDQLVENDFLPATYVERIPDLPSNKVDFGRVIRFKLDLLDEAYRYFSDNAAGEQLSQLEQFKLEHRGWLGDYALFMALKEYHIENEGGVWNAWPEGISRRLQDDIKQWSIKLSERVRFHEFTQFLFFKQWLALKKYANDHGITIIGDAPIFVAFDSADVWANPEIYYLNDSGSPTVIAGVPPDYFSETGQRWGNPLYRWEIMAQDNYKWWSERLRMVFNQVDIVRIDHFRGFEAYWEIPADEPTAVIGRWVNGPNIPFFETMRNSLGELPIIAEDLGVITPEVEAMRDKFEFPGMKILQFAFGGERNSNFLPHNFGRNCVVYTGTHDNETTLGWYRNSSVDEKDHMRRYMASDGSDIAWDMIRLAYASVADTVVIPLQDLMSLGNEARMNYPGKVGGWWTWRYTEEMLTDSILDRIRELVELFSRVPD